MSSDYIEEVHFSPGNNCLNAILKYIRQAKEKIDICVFTISDDRIANEIIKAFQLGVKIRIITDNDKTFDRGSDVEIFNRLEIPVKIDKTSSHMHHKYAIFDNEIMLTGSFNWTRSATNYNNENIIVTNSANLVEPFVKEFEKLWWETIKY